MPTPPVDPVSLLIIALLNPLVAAIGFLMGRSADQAQKLVVAGFAASAVGVLGVWLAAKVGLLPLSRLTGVAGLFVLQFLIGVAWAGLGYRLRGSRR